jgi:lysozyme
MNMRVFDASAFQSNLSLFKNADYDGTILKATEGSKFIGKYVSPLCDKQYQIAKSRGKGRGVYHFAGSSVKRQIDTPHNEWSWFYQNILGYIHDGILMLDFEPYGYGINPAYEAEWVMQWMELAHGTTQVWPILYMSASKFTEFHSFNESVAREIAAKCGALVAGGYTYNNVQGFGPNKAARPKIPDYWNLFGWQYTSHGNIDGFQPLDLDDVYVDEEGWHHYAIGQWKGDQVKPTQAPVQYTPPKYEPVMYTIKPGDNLTKIAAQFGTTWQNIVQLNHIPDANIIYAGNQIRVK